MPGTGARPVRMIAAAIRFTRSTGMANPMPADAPDPEMIAVSSPIIRPALSISGPPELPD